MVKRECKTNACTELLISVDFSVYSEPVVDIGL